MAQTNSSAVDEPPEAIQETELAADVTETREQINVPANDDNRKDDNTRRGWVGQAWQWSRPSVLCPGVSKLYQLTFAVVLLLLALGVAVSVLGESALPPSGPIFQLLMLFIVAEVMGRLISVARLPPLLGMLLSGILLRNVGVFEMEGGYLKAVASLRLGAMVVILIKAGIGLDPQALRRLSYVVLRLALCPCFVEAVTGMCAAHLLLGMPWLWGILLGCILAAVSPAVVVPSLLSLKERGFGEDKGISTLVIAASSIDDIAAISAFGVVLGTIFSEGSLTGQILQGPLEVLMGLGFGACYGLLLIYMPHAQQEYVCEWRATLLACGGVLAVFGSQAIGYAGAGPLGCIVAAFIAACGWKAEVINKACEKSVAPIYSALWMVFQPVLFGLIGTEIVISQLDRSTVLLGLGVLCFGLTFRILTVAVVTLGAELSLKERLFVAVAWLPKATVQAALAPVALDLARETGASEEIIFLAEQVLTVAVLSILVTAPLGSIGINVTGPLLLSKPREQADSEVPQA